MNFKISLVALLCVAGIMSVNAGRSNVPTPSNQQTKVIGTLNVLSDTTFTEVYPNLADCYKNCPDCICEETAADTPVNIYEVD